MIETVELSRFSRVATSGRNEPLMVTIEDGVDEIDVYLKPSPWKELTVNSLACEALACMLACDVNVPLCKPYIVRMDREWVNAIADDHIRRGLQGVGPMAFASTSAGDGWRPWVEGDRLSAALRQDALNIYAFDAWINNADRKRDNSNLLVKNDQLRAIDHELAFLYEGMIPRITPWERGNLGLSLTVQNHVFRGALTPTDNEWAVVRDCWASLTMERLNEYLGVLPQEWDAARPQMDTAIRQIGAIVQRIDDCVDALRNV